MICESDLANELNSLEIQRRECIAKLQNIAGAEQMANHLLSRLQRESEEALKMLNEIVTAEPEPEPRPKKKKCRKSS